MKVIVEFLFGTLIMVPILIHVIGYLIFRKITKNNSKSFGYAADITTFFLIFSVYLSVSTLWSELVGIMIFAFAIIVGIILTIFEWKTKREMEVIPLMRKIWRILFVYLSFIYIVVWIIGIIQSIIVFTT